MHDIIAFLKEAVNRTVGSGLEGCYVVRDGAIYARNHALQAGIDWLDGADFTVPAEALDAALARMKAVDELKIDEDSVVLRCGRLKSTIKRDKSPTVPVPDFGDNWLPSPPGLAAALDVAKDFVSMETRNTWTEGVRIMLDRVTALSGRAGVDLEVSGLGLDRAYLLPPATVKFLVAQGDPDRIGPERNAITFRWDDGRWARSRLIDNEMPESTVRRIFDDAGDEAPIKIDQEWREALADAVALSDGTVSLSAAGLHGIKEAITTDVDLGVAVDAAHRSYWDAKMLTLVINRAAAWNPERYPHPALFVGPGFRGVIAGTKR